MSEDTSTSGCQNTFTVSTHIKEEVEINSNHDKDDINEINVKNELNLEYEADELHCNELNESKSIENTCSLLSDNCLNLKIEKVECMKDISILKNDGFIVNQESDSEFEQHDLSNEDPEILIPDSCPVINDNYFVDTDNINIYPKVIKITKANLDNEEVLTELNCVKDNKEVIISDSIHSDFEFNVGDLLSPLEYRCSVCQKQYRYLKSLQRHESAHKSSKLSKNNEEIVDVDGSYACFCGKVYRRRSSVTSCLKSHESAGLTCKWCSKVFDRKVDMKLHICSRRKSIKSKFHCNMCTKTFRFQSNLIKHKRMHMVKHKANQKEDKRINKYLQCKDCSLKFLKKSLYENHIESHKNNTEEFKKKTKFMFKCNECGKGCLTLKTFTKHKLKHEKKDKNECSRCEDKFDSRSELVTHRKLYCRGGQYHPKSTHTYRKSNKHPCDVCSQEFSSKELMLEHKAEHPFLIFAKDDSTHTQIFFK